MSDDDDIQPDYLLPGQKVGPYTIVCKLGTGGFGAAYRVTRDDEEMALKILLTRETSSNRGEEKARIDREFALLQLISHPNIVKVTASEMLGHHRRGYPYIVMDFIEGLEVYKWQHRSRPSLRQICSAAKQIADALVHIHARGLTHRDIKSQNVLVQSDGKPVLIDFGIARTKFARTLTRADTLVGTISHFSPEYCRWTETPEYAQGKDYPYSPQGDFWALGIMLYETLTGRLPYELRFQDRAEAVANQEFLDAIVQQAPFRPSIANPDIPPQIEQILLQMLQKDPQQRLLDRDFIDQVDDALLDADARWDEPFEVPLRIQSMETSVSRLSPGQQPALPTADVPPPAKPAGTPAKADTLPQPVPTKAHRAATPAKSPPKAFASVEAKPPAFQSPDERPTFPDAKVIDPDAPPADSHDRPTEMESPVYRPDSTRQEHPTEPAGLSEIDPGPAPEPNEHEERHRRLRQNKIHPMTTGLRAILDRVRTRAPSPRLPPPAPAPPEHPRPIHPTTTGLRAILDGVRARAQSPRLPPPVAQSDQNPGMPVPAPAHPRPTALRNLIAATRTNGQRRIQPSHVVLSVLILLAVVIAVAVRFIAAPKKAPGISLTHELDDSRASEPTSPPKLEPRGSRLPPADLEHVEPVLIVPAAPAAPASTPPATPPPASNPGAALGVGHRRPSAVALSAIGVSRPGTPDQTDIDRILAKTYGHPTIAAAPAAATHTEAPKPEDPFAPVQSLSAKTATVDPKALGIGTGRRIHVRLRTPLDSRTIGDGPVEFQVISAVEAANGDIAIPALSLGYARASTSTGRFTLAANLLKLPNGTEVPFAGTAYDRKDGKPGLPAGRQITPAVSQGDSLPTQVAKSSASTALTAVSGGLGQDITRNAATTAINGQDPSQGGGGQTILLLDSPYEFDLMVQKPF